jgi:hypothetical protein
MNLRLISLDCPSCGSALHGEGLDTIFFCDHCGDAAILGEDGLEMVESTALVPAAGRSAAIWRPAWLIESEVTVSERVRHKGRRSDGWQERRIYVIPAFEMPLGDLTRIARALAELAGETREVPREPIHGGTLDVDDAVTLIRHLVIGDEVRKSDMLASVMVDIDVVASRLVALPFEQTKDGLRCSITGVTVSAGD